MEIIQDNSPTIKVECLNCGSILSAKEGEIIKKTIENYNWKSKSRWINEYFISICPCCRVVNPKIKIIKNETDN